MPLILPGNVGSATAATEIVSNSCRFNRGSTDFLNKTLGTPTDIDKATFSTWIKFSDVTSSNDTAIFAATADGNNTTHLEKLGSQVFRLNMREGSSYIGVLTTNRVFRDPSAWYHIVVAFDTTQGTGSNRVKLYVNGVQETSFSTATYPTQNVDLRFNTSGQVFRIGHRGDAANSPDAYFAETVFVDGLQLAADSFGEFDSDTGIWKPINVSGLTFGNNGFYLDYEDSSNLGNDANGGTDFTENNLTAVDQSTDTCVNNFATLNPISTGNKQAQRHVTLSEGNLFAVGNSSSNNGNAYTTIAVNTGKWYCEIKATDVRGTGYPYIGVCNETCHNQGGQAGLDSSSGVDGVAYSPDGRKNINGTSSSYGNSFTDNDIIGIALDLDNGAVYFSKNGTFQASGDPTSGASKTNAVHTFTVGDHYFFALSVFEAASDVSCNFGSPAFAISSGNTDGSGFGNFEYAVPSGYFSLCTKNLAEYG